MSDIKKIYNENTIPLVDELMYYFKYICRDIVLKDPVLADKNETIDSVKAGDLFLLCKDNRANIGHFSYTIEELSSYGLPITLIPGYIKNPNTIPENIKVKIIANRTKSYIDEYEELNKVGS